MPVVKYIFKYPLPVIHFALSDILWVLINKFSDTKLFPISHFQRIPLDFLQDESFKKAVGKYIKPLLTKVSFNALESLCYTISNRTCFLYILMVVSGCSFIIF